MEIASRKKILCLSATGLILYILTGGFGCSSRLAAQPGIMLGSGLGNMEHFSLHAGYQFKKSGELGLIFGSNAFNDLHDFSTLLIEYGHTIFPSKTGRIILRPLLKAGYSLYSNAYYQWQTLTIIPAAGIAFGIDKGLEMRLQAGIAVNKELAEKRLAWGELGYYPRYLPEIKLEFIYVLSGK